MDRTGPNWYLKRLESPFLFPKYKPVSSISFSLDFRSKRTRTTTIKFTSFRSFFIRYSISPVIFNLNRNIHNGLDISFSNYQQKQMHNFPR
ncbi:hypothetical protein L6452_33195 [Arctium lappa]|uniref:Uncharacterized protein n=1 Tax=Arctium lappa TaxID=4217 RepID=A0ACB8Z7U6_ARCLA|nr:hypothetical protein L6452_33195 [Arctium lappa]